MVLEEAMLGFWWNGIIVTDEYKTPALCINLGREGAFKLGVLHR